MGEVLADTKGTLNSGSRADARLLGKAASALSAASGGAVHVGKHCRYLEAALRMINSRRLSGKRCHCDYQTSCCKKFGRGRDCFDPE